ncbi:MAG: glutathione S-transferase family protein [Hyphomicrobiales bacterium]|nr:MAG: glutathione S-transferase family protein [Hyphomicrobiales bacterium]
MPKKLTVYGFDASTYVRTVRMLLAEKGAKYDQVDVNVLEGEPRQPAHIKRHPFGKVPVIEHDGLKIIETSAITRYLDDVLPGKKLIPGNPKDRARMDMCLSVIDCYGYGALVGVAAYHLFPDFVGGKNEEMRKECIEKSRLVLTELMKLRGKDNWIAGSEPTLADFFLAPICFYVNMTEDKDKVFDVPGFADWWKRVQGLKSYISTEPDLG